MIQSFSLFVISNITLLHATRIDHSNSPTAARAAVGFLQDQFLPLSGNPPRNRRGLRPSSRFPKHPREKSAQGKKHIPAHSSISQIPPCVGFSPLPPPPCPPEADWLLGHLPRAVAGGGDLHPLAAFWGFLFFGHRLNYAMCGPR